MRAIVFLLLVILIFFIVRFTLNRIIEIRQEQNQQNRSDSDDSDSNSTNESGHESMVRCAECGVHLPQSEAYYDGKDTFCSEGHMKKYHQGHADQD